MPLLNYPEMMTGLIKHIRYAVGSKLSTLKVTPSSDPLAAVIKDRSKGPRPDFPYIVVDRKTTTKTDGSSLRHEEVITNPNGTYDVIYRTEHTIGYTITCYGEDADSILNHYQVSTIDEISRNRLNGFTSTTYQYCTDITENPIFIETDFIDGATMDMYFTVVSDYIPPETSIIEVVKGEGRYQEIDRVAATEEIFVDENNPKEI